MDARGKATPLKPIDLNNTCNHSGEYAQSTVQVTAQKVPLAQNVTTKGALFDGPYGGKKPA